ncbi:TetR/AcrR family transcriptional regulator [Dysgonomonas sp. 511]|uniref:TetR/AcrR family transcriptional regulator n=1 Tax=Dysgonomonas sp. 511 TaxID=2302930 RepID=UPI0013D40A7E|nr:TetR/AcrR family transcriptional regulator [Dysgonomonas sp. 511]NDV79069.1 TetR/AcrR family transcriptional regulator [Dysgonomonas sp. 511]
MKYSREYIIRRAFDVFMAKGYDSASISVLQEELGMSRGAMYRYFKNKKDLFEAVIDEYCFRLFERMLKGAGDDLTVAELIEIMHRRQRLMLNIFTRAGVTHTTFLNYTALMIQAAKYYPDFTSHFADINSRLLSRWERAISKSIAKGEVRPDVNIEITSIMFNSISIKESSTRGKDESVFVINVKHDFERRKEVLDYLYSLIKI